jgi:hypothetical protein
MKKRIKWTRPVLAPELARDKEQHIRLWMTQEGLYEPDLDRWLAELRTVVTIASDMGRRFRPRSLTEAKASQFIDTLSRFSATLETFRKTIQRQTIWMSDAEQERALARFGGDADGYRGKYKQFRDRTTPLVRDLMSSETALKTVADRMPDFLACLSRPASRSGRPGASKDIGMWILSVNVARLLREAGLEVSKTRGGLFERIIRVLHPGTRDVQRPVQVSFVLLKRAADFVRAIDAYELESGVLWRLPADRGLTR